MAKTLHTLFRIGVVASVAIVLSAAIAAGAATADDGGLEAMEGEGTEDDPYVITDVHELQAMNQDLEAHYVLGADIDASETETWEAGAGFEPIGDEDDWFAGTFDGRGYTIEGLQIDRPNTHRVGLFGYTFDSTLENVRLETVAITGGEESGGFVAFNTGDIRNVTVSGRVQGTGETLGGVTGYNSGTITRSEFVGAVEGTDTVGGLAAINTGPIDFSYTVVTVDGREHVGGFVGLNSGPIRTSFTTGDVTGESVIGGFVGSNSDAINDVYSTANASGDEIVGGLAGSNSGTVTSSYTTGTVIGAETDAGLIASNSGIVDAVYWNVQTSGHADAYVNDHSDESDVTGLESDELTGEDAIEATELDFDSNWVASDDYPRLQWEADRDIPSEAYDVITEPVALEENDGSGESTPEPGDEADDRDPGSDGDDNPLGVPGFGAVPAAVALLAAVALIGYRER